MIEINRKRRGHKFAPRKGVPALCSQDGKGYEATVYEHYFVGGCDWYITEYDSESHVAFGWAETTPGFGELGYVDLAELESVLAQGIFPVERELDWNPVTLSEALKVRS